MYEIWLMLNILWELLLPIMPLVLILFVIWAGLMMRAGLSPVVNWSRGLGQSLMVGVVAGVVAFFGLPAALKSGLSEMGYWADWLTLCGLALGACALVAVLLWPIMAARRPAH